MQIDIYIYTHTHTHTHTHTEIQLLLCIHITNYIYAGEDLEGNFQVGKMKI